MMLVVIFVYSVSRKNHVDDPCIRPGRDHLLNLTHVSAAVSSNVKFRFDSGSLINLFSCAAKILHIRKIDDLAVNVLDRSII